MNSAILERSEEKRVRQSLFTVSRAEFIKLLSPGGVRFWVILSGIFGILSGVGTVLLSGIQSLQDLEPISFSDFLTSGPLVASLVLSLAAANYVPRELSEGIIITSKYLVPRVELLFVARFLSWAVVSILIGIISALFAFLASLVSSNTRKLIKAESLPVLLVAIVLSSLLVLLSHSGATLLRRGALIVAAGMAFLFVLPLGFAVLSLTVPGGITEIFSWLSKIMIGYLLLTALQIPSGAGGAWGSWAWAVFGMALWLLAITFFSFALFRKPEYGDV